MSKTTIPEKHTSHESKDQGCGCGGAHKHHKPAPPQPQRENVAQADDSKSETTQEHGKHSDCCGGGKASK